MDCSVGSENRWDRGRRSASNSIGSTDAARAPTPTERVTMKYNLDEVKAEPLELTVGGKEYTVERMSIDSLLTLTKKFEESVKEEETVTGQYEVSIAFVRRTAPAIPESTLRELDAEVFQRLSQVVMAYHYGEPIAPPGSDSGNPEPAQKGGPGNAAVN